jgi:hypothetical protein
MKQSLYKGCFFMPCLQKIASSILIGTAYRVRFARKK